MSNEDKNFIRLVDDEGFETKFDLKNNNDLIYLLKNLREGTKVQIRFDNWFGLDAVVVPFDAVVPE